MQNITIEVTFIKLFVFEFDLTVVNVNDKLLNVVKQTNI